MPTKGSPKAVKNTGPSLEGVVTPYYSRRNSVCANPRGGTIRKGYLSGNPVGQGARKHRLPRWSESKENANQEIGAPGRGESGADEAGVEGAGDGGILGALDNGATVGEDGQFRRWSAEAEQEVVVLDFGGGGGESAAQRAEVEGAAAFVDLHGVATAHGDLGLR